MHVDVTTIDFDDLCVSAYTLQSYRNLFINFYLGLTIQCVT